HQCRVVGDDHARLQHALTRWNDKRGVVRCYIAFLSRLSGAKDAELRAAETPCQSVRYSIDLLPGTPSSVPRRRSDACRAKGESSMCDRTQAACSTARAGRPP